MLKILILTLTTLLAPLAIAEETTTPDPLIIIKTSEGEITLRLFQNKAPITVANFLAYVDAGHYNDTVFHRVINDFMIQGGGFNLDMSEKPVGEPIINESKNRLHNTRGTIAMARTNDPDSATAQFFINQRNNMRLDWAPRRPGYTVFGEVISGMKVVDFIATAPTGQLGGYSDVPMEPIMIKEIVRKAQP